MPETEEKTEMETEKKPKEKTNKKEMDEERLSSLIESESDSESADAEQKVKSEKKEEKPGVAYVYTTANNTLVHITDLSGNTISRISGGMVTKQSRLKSSPTIAMFVAKKAAERARDLGITTLFVRIRGNTGATNLGPGGHAAVKSLSKEGFRIVNILDTTRVARGGPKKKGGKRGRRV